MITRQNRYNVLEKMVHYEELIGLVCDDVPLQMVKRVCSSIDDHGKADI